MLQSPAGVFNSMNHVTCKPHSYMSSISHETSQQPSLASEASVASVLSLLKKQHKFTETSLIPALYADTETFYLVNLASRSFKQNIVNVLGF